jgi:hypothetical protein
MLMCFQSKNPEVSIELVVKGHAEEIEGAAQAGVQDTARLVAERFERQPEDA